MTDEGVDQLIRQAIAGNAEAIAWLSARAQRSDDPTLLVMAALLAVPSTGQLLVDRAAAAATYREERQVVAIARAHLAGDRELVDALARDHLVDFPGSYVVAWVASGAEVGGGSR